MLEVLSRQPDAFNATHVRWLGQLAKFVQVLSHGVRSNAAFPATDLDQRNSRRDQRRTAG